MSQEAMWWYLEHERALAGLRGLSTIPQDSDGISKTYLWLTRLTERERPNFKEFASRLAGYYVFGVRVWPAETIEKMRRNFNYYLEGMNVGVSAATTAKVKILIELFGLEKIVYEIDGKAIVMKLRQAS